MEATPSARVGTRLLLEDGHARIWEIRLAPGERVPLHRHVLDYFWTCVSGGRATSRDAAGQVIGTSGTTGFSTGCHLHFELYVNSTLVDPEPWLPAH